MRAYVEPNAVYLPGCGGSLRAAGRVHRLPEPNYPRLPVPGDAYDPQPRRAVGPSDTHGCRSSGRRSRLRDRWSSCSSTGARRTREWTSKAHRTAGGPRSRPGQAIRDRGQQRGDHSAGCTVARTSNLTVAAPYESNYLSRTAIAIRPALFPRGAAGSLFPRNSSSCGDIMPAWACSLPPCCSGRVVWSRRYWPAHPGPRPCWRESRFGTSPFARHVGGQLSELSMRALAGYRTNA